MFKLPHNCTHLTSQQSNDQNSPSEVSTKNFQTFKLDLGKAEEAEIKLPTSFGSLKKLESSRKKIYFCFIDYAKAFDCVDHNKLENSQRDGTTRPPDCLLRNLYAGQEVTVRTGHRITDWFQIGKGVRQGCILSPSYLTYIQSTSCKMPGWMKYKLENSERVGNTRPPDMPPEKSVCRSRSNSQNWTWNNRLVPNRKRSTSRLYIVTLLI